MTNLTDKYGFPIDVCVRCNGSGTYPSSAWNGVCLGCSGQRYTHVTPKVAALAGQWQTRKRDAVTVVPAARRDPATGEVTCGVQPGDRIREYGVGEVPWRTVAEVTVHPERVVGSVRIGNVLTQETLAVTLLFEDGSTVEVRAGNVWRRPAPEGLDGERQALVDQAVKSYATTLKRRETAAVKAAAKRATEEAERSANVQQLVETYPELATLAGDDYAEATGFMADMRRAILSGKPTDAQRDAAVAAVRRDQERAVERDRMRGSGVAVPTGRVTVTGTIVAVWTKDTDWGVRDMMRIRSDEGWTAAGAIPAKLRDVAGPEFDDMAAALRGRQVTITAEFQPGRDDQLSGFFRRPTVARS